MSFITRRSVITTSLAAGLAAGLVTTADAKPILGKPAPKFTLHTFDRRKITQADLAGQVVVLNFWAVWCGPCKAELPAIDAYVRKAGDDLRVFAVTVDDTVADSALKPLASVLSFPLVTRIDGNYGPIGGAVPSNYIIDRNGILRYAEANAFSYGSFAATVGPLLAEKATPVPAAPTATT